LSVRGVEVKGECGTRPFVLTSPCFGFAKTFLSFAKERDVAERQGEVSLAFRKERDVCAADRVS